MPQFVLKVQDIDTTGREYHFPVPVAWLGQALGDSGIKADLSAGEGRLDVTAQRSGDDILVQGRLMSGAVAECVRCLEDAKVPVNVEVASLFVSRGDGHRSQIDEDDLSPEELMREFFSGEEIVLDDLVRESVILEVPMQPVCREDCPGIEVPAHVRPPADFGVETGEEVDPRLASLKNLAVKAQGEE